MTDAKFIEKWPKTRKRGSIPYVLGYTLVCPLASLITKSFVEFICLKQLRAFSLLDYIGLILLCLISFLIGVCNWNRNNQKYKKLTQPLNHPLIKD